MTEARSAHFSDVLARSAPFIWCSCAKRHNLFNILARSTTILKNHNVKCMGRFAQECQTLALRAKKWSENHSLKEERAPRHTMIKLDMISVFLFRSRHGCGEFQNFGDVSRRISRFLLKTLGRGGDLRRYLRISSIFYFVWPNFKSVTLK